VTTDSSYSGIIKDFAKKYGVLFRREQAIIDDFRKTVDFLNTHLEIMPDFMFQLKIARRWNRRNTNKENNAKGGMK
jgi:hypothetical protein